MAKFTSNQIAPSAIITNLLADKTVTSDKIAENITLKGDITIDGNLSITGGLTNEDTKVETLLVESNEIVLNASLTASDIPHPDGGRIKVNRGNANRDVYLRWREDRDVWQFDQNLEMVGTDKDSDGKYVTFNRYSTGETNAINADSYGGLIFDETYADGTSTTYMKMYYDGVNNQLKFLGSNADGTSLSDTFTISRNGRSIANQGLRIHSGLSLADKHYISDATLALPIYNAGDTLKFYSKSDYDFFSASATVPSKLTIHGENNSNNIKIYNEAGSTKFVNSNLTGGFTWYSGGTADVNKLLYLANDKTLSIYSALIVDSPSTSKIDGGLLIGNNASTIKAGFELDIRGATAVDGGLHLDSNAKLLGYQDALWYHPSTAGKTYGEFVVGSSHSWDNAVSFKYAPSTIGAGTGDLTIGQTCKNNTNYTHGYTRFYTNGLERMRINKDGYVGIGNVSPTEALQVNGNIKANNVLSNYLVSTVATGTAPLTITSTTVVANLNADLLDGKNSTDFIQESDFNGYFDLTTTEWANMRTNQNKWLLNKPLYVTGEIYAGASYDQKVWHTGNDGASSGLDADLLDGKHASEFYQDGTVIMNTNPFGGKKLYINNINNALFNANKRFTVTGTLYNSDGSVNTSGVNVSALFDGNYETNLNIPADKYLVVLLDFNGIFPGGYPYGNLYISHYYTEYSQSASVRTYTNYVPHGVGWHAYAFSDFVRNGTTNLITKARQDIYDITQMEFTITAPVSVAAKITQIDFQLDRPCSAEMPILDKYSQNKLYYNLNMNSNKVINIADPVSNMDAMNKQYADATYLKLAGGTLSNTLTFSVDNVGMDFYQGARVYKKSGAGLRIKAHSDIHGIVMSNAADTDLLVVKDAGFTYKGNNIYHVGNKPTLIELGALGSTDNAISASKWQTARTLTLGGDVTGSISIDGTSDVTLTTIVGDDSHNHTNYRVKQSIYTTTTATTEGWYRVATIPTTALHGTALFKIRGYTATGTITESTITINHAYYSGNYSSQYTAITANTSHSCNSSTNVEAGYVLLYCRVSFDASNAYIDMYKYKTTAVTMDIMPLVESDWVWATGALTVNPTIGAYRNTQVTMDAGFRGNSLNAAYATYSSYSQYGTLGTQTLSNTTDKTGQWAYFGNWYFEYNSSYLKGKSGNIRVRFSEINYDGTKDPTILENFAVNIKVNLGVHADANTFNTLIPTFNMEIEGSTTITENDICALVYSTSTTTKYIRFYIKLREANTVYCIDPEQRYGRSFNTTNGQTTGYCYFNFTGDQTPVVALPTPAQGTVVYSTRKIVDADKLDGKHASDLLDKTNSSVVGTLAIDTAMKMMKQSSIVQVDTYDAVVRNQEGTKWSELRITDASTIDGLGVIARGSEDGGTNWTEVLRATGSEFKHMNSNVYTQANLKRYKEKYIPTVNIEADLEIIIPNGRTFSNTEQLDIYLDGRYMNTDDDYSVIGNNKISFKYPIPSYSRIDFTVTTI